MCSKSPENIFLPFDNLNTDNLNSSKPGTSVKIKIVSTKKIFLKVVYSYIRKKLYAAPKLYDP